MPPCALLQTAPMTSKLSYRNLVRGEQTASAAQRCIGQAAHWEAAPSFHNTRHNTQHKVALQYLVMRTSKRMHHRPHANVQLLCSATGQMSRQHHARSKPPHLLEHRCNCDATAELTKAQRARIHRQIPTSHCHSHVTCLKPYTPSRARA